MENQHQRRLNVLIACEYSGAVREAFRALGHNAYSCDLIKADDDSPYHIQGDCWPVIQGVPRGGFPNGVILGSHLPWDLIVMHPPCTALCVSGNSTYAEGKPKWAERQASIAWTKSLWDHARAHCDHVAMENPVGVLSTLGGLKSSQYIQPWQYGHGETKKTGLWLHGLPELVPTGIVAGRVQRMHLLPPSEDRWKIRSATYKGIAEAMATQWSASILNG